MTGAVFSFMDGIIHPYYTVALAPAIAALVGISRPGVVARQGVSAPAGSRWRPCWQAPACGRSFCWTAPRTGCRRCGGSCWPARSSTASVLAVGAHRLGRASVVLAIGAMLFGLGGTAAYTIETVAHAHSGTDGHLRSGQQRNRRSRRAGGRSVDPVRSPTIAELEALIESADNRWAAASVGSMTAGSLELKTGTSVMAIGGFTGSDNSPTLAQFQALRRRPRGPLLHCRRRHGRPAAASRAVPPTSPPGCSRTSHPSMSVARPCTT